MSLISTVFKSDERILNDPEPIIAIHELNDSSVDIIARPWFNRHDYWITRWDLIRKVKQVFDENDKTIPFPQRDVH